jgi:hypothetical protein
MSYLPPVVCRRAHVLFTLFVGGLMSYLRYMYLWLFAYSGVQHILCCVFVLFFFILCTLCCQFLWIVHFCLSLRYSLTFINSKYGNWEWIKISFNPWLYLSIHVQLSPLIIWPPILQWKNEKKHLKFGLIREMAFGWRGLIRKGLMYYKCNTLFHYTFN